MPAKIISMDGFNRKMAKILSETGAMTSDRAKVYAPKRSRSPEELTMAQSIDFQSDPGSMSVTISTHKPYAGFVERGTEPMVAAHGEHDPHNPVWIWDAKSGRNKYDLEKIRANEQIMPFMSVAAFEVEPEVKSLFAKYFKGNRK